jgi:hypothetical protein
MTITIDIDTAVKHAHNQGRRGQKLSEAYRYIEQARDAHSKAMQQFLKSKRS